MVRLRICVSVVVVLLAAICFATTTGCAQERPPLALDSPTTHRLTANNTSQWYAVTLPSPGELAVTLRCEGNLAAVLYLYHGSSNLNSDTSGTNQIRRVERKDLYSDTYYVYVYRYSGEGAYTIEATHTPTAYAEDTEPNANANSASLIPINQATQGLLGYLTNNQADAYDWYKVTTTVPGSLSIDLQAEDSLKFEAHLYDTNGTTSLSSDSAGSFSSRKLARHDLLPGTYYVWLYRTMGYGGYTVQPVFTPHEYASDQEPSDAADQAQTISENDSVTGLLGFYTGGKTDTYDWYKVTTTQPGQLSITITGEETLSFQGYLYDTNKSSSLHTDNSGTKSSRFLQRSDLEAGTYYFYLYRTGGYGGYILETAHVVQPLQQDAEPNNTVQTAASVELNQLQTGQLGYYGNGKLDSYDYYQLELSEYTNLRTVIKADDTLYFQAYLYDSNQSSTLSSDNSGSKSVREVQRTDLRPGTYTLYLYRTGGYGGYTIMPIAQSHPIQPQARPATSIKLATPLTLNTPLGNLLGFYNAGATDNESWYSFSVDNEGPLLVHVVMEDPLRLELRLYDQNGSASKGSDDSGQPLARLISLPKTPAGTYTTRLYRTALSGAYSILVTDKESGLMANPNTYKFGDTQQESITRAMTLAVINLNNTPVLVQSVQLTGRDADSFNINSESLVNQTIAARNHGLIQVAFAPDSAGRKSATLTIVADAETLTIPLEGTGYINFPGEPVEVEDTGETLYAWTDKPVYLPRETIHVTLSNLPGNTQDWIALSPKDSPDSQYAQWDYTHGVREGTKTFNGLSEGTYELRTYFDWPSGGFVVQSRYEFFVSEEQAALPNSEQPSALPETRASGTAQQPVPPPQAQGVQMTQWATSATASSQYSAAGWSTLQSTGEPNTYPQYGDLNTAWAPSNQNHGTEWLELTYATPVYATRIEVYETYNPGATVKVEVGTPDGTWHTVWTGTATPAEAKACIVTYDVDLYVLVNKVRLTLDTTKVPGWNEIDAVGLVGIAQEQAVVEQDRVPQELALTPQVTERQAETEVTVTVTSSIPAPTGGVELATSPPVTPSETLGVTQSPAEITEPLLLPPPPLSFEEKLAAIEREYENSSAAQIAVIESLAVLGASGVPQLLPYLSHSDKTIVSAALDTLGEIGPVAQSASSHLAALLTHPEKSVRSATVSAISAIGIADAELSLAMQQYVIQAPSSEATSLRRGLAALNKSSLAPQSTTIAALVGMIDLTDYAGGADLRAFLVRGGSAVAQALIPVLQTGTANQKVLAANVLQSMGELGNIALPALLNSCQDADANVRRRMVAALAYVAPGAAKVAVTLVNALDDANEDVVYEAAWGLSRSSYQDEATFSALLAAIEMYMDKSRIANPLASTAAKYGAPLVPKVEQWLQNERSSAVGIRAAGALGNLGAPFVPQLIQLYVQANTEIKANIVSALGNIGHSSGYPLLKQATEAPEAQIRREAARALAKFPEHSPEMIATLLKLAEDGNYTTALAAIEGLGEIGTPALDVAIAKLESADAKERAMSVAIISEMGLSAAPAVPALYEQSLKESDETLKAAYDQLLFDIWKLPDMDIPEQSIASTVDLAELAATDWQLAVLTAKELVRSIMGPLEEHEAVLFDQQWEPMFRYPSIALFDYFGELNPLLNLFLSTRAALVETGYNYQNALTDAWAALSYADYNALERAMLSVGYCQESLLGLQKQIATVGEELMALLPPPDPEELQANVRKRHEESLLAIAGFDIEDTIDDNAPGKYWVMTSKEPHIQKARTAIDWWAGAATIQAPFSSGEGMSAGSEIATGGDLKDNTYTASGYVRWTPPPSIVPYGSSFSYPFQADLGFSASPDTWLMSIQGASLGIGNGGQSLLGWKVNGQAESGRPARNSWSIDALLSIPVRELHWGSDDQIRLVFTALSPGGVVTYTYIYKLAELDVDTVDEMMALDRKEKYLRAEIEEQNTQEYLQEYVQAQQRIDALALHNEQAQYFKEQADRTRQELLNTTDPDATGALAWQLMVLEANHQGELDNAQIAQSGQWVRTRTAYDDYVQLRMAQQSVEAAEEIALRQRIVSGLPKLIALAPKEDQEDLKRFVDRNLDVTDTEQMRKLVAAVGNQVQGHWEGVGAEAEYQAAVAEEKIFWAEMTKMAAGAIVTGGAAPLAAGLGASAQVVAWAPTAVRIAYGGTTGFVEGGTGEAIKQSVAWSHQIGYLATEAYAGYNTTMQDGQKGGFTEAAWRTATAYMYGKMFEYGTNLSSRALVKVLGKSSTTPLFGRGYQPSVQDRFDMAKYQQDLDRSQALVRQWQDKQFQLAAASASGVAGPQVAALNQEVNQLVASINATYHAKWLLKHQMPANVQRIYNAQIAQVYGGVMPTYITNLQALGYDTSNLQFDAIRNASSGNSVGMDFDLRLVEDTRVTISKNGKRVSRFEFMQDAQKAWNTSYYSSTGYSAVQSDIHITTLAHPEAFADTALLQRNIDFTSIDPSHIQQAGDVFRTKAQMSMTSHQYNSISQTQAVSRDLEKELRTKVLPFVDTRIKQEALRGNTTNLRKLQETKQHWTNVYNRVDQIGRQTTDPVEIRRLQQELELLTGQKPAELMNQMGYHFETLGKFYR